MARVIDLNGPDGNAFVLLGIAKTWTLQLAAVDPERYNWDRISEEMRAGDYDNLVSVFKEYFSCVADVIDVDEDDDWEDDDNFEE